MLGIRPIFSERAVGPCIQNSQISFYMSQMLLLNLPNVYREAQTFFNRYIDLMHSSRLTAKSVLPSHICFIFMSLKHYDVCESLSQFFSTLLAEAETLFLYLVELCSNNEDKMKVFSCIICLRGCICLWIWGISNLCWRNLFLKWTTVKEEHRCWEETQCPPLNGTSLSTPHDYQDTDNIVDEEL